VEALADGGFKAAVARSREEAADIDLSVTGLMAEHAREIGAAFPIVRRASHRFSSSVPLRKPFATYSAVVASTAASATAPTERTPATYISTTLSKISS